MGKRRLGLKSFAREQLGVELVQRPVAWHPVACLLETVHSMPSEKQLEVSFGPLAVPDKERQWELAWT